MSRHQPRGLSLGEVSDLGEEDALIGRRPGISHSYIVRCQTAPVGQQVPMVQTPVGVRVCRNARASPLQAAGRLILPLIAHGSRSPHAALIKPIAVVESQATT